MGLYRSEVVWVASVEINDTLILVTSFKGWSLSIFIYFELVGLN